MIKHPRRIAAALLSTKHRASSALQFEDSEFGVVICRRSASGRYVRLRLTSDGRLRATLPPGGNLKHVKSLIESSRPELRRLLQQQRTTQPFYRQGQQIGQSHRLELTISLEPTASHRIKAQTIYVALPAETDSSHPTSQDAIRSAVKVALRREAKAYLPRRLNYLAENHGFQYKRIRFANQSGRWGSCSSSGTISLNIALMNLPMELIDYVLTHELCHTVYLNHQEKFWALVESLSPDYRILRQELKAHNPYI